MAFSGFTNTICLERVDSTNRYLADLARGGAPEGVVVVADSQSAGRGRRGRSWFAPAGSSLLCSFLVRPSLPAVALHLVPSAFALALLDALKAELGLRAALKWPNDVVVAGAPGPSGDGSRPGERKVAGLLAELVAAGGTPEGIVVGLGVNIAFPPGFPPSDADGELASLREGATTLEAVCEGPVSRREVFAALVEAAEERYRQALDPTRHGVLVAAYAAALSTLGRLVEVDLGDRRLVGTAAGLDGGGRLVLETEAGEVAVEAGDVVHLRSSSPAPL